MVTVYGDEEPATQEQATPIRFDTSYEQPENLSLDQYIDAAVERAIRKLDAPVATMIRSFNATPDRHENMIIATPQQLNDTVMVTPHQHDNTVVATPNRHVATVVATPEKINTDLDILTMLNEEKTIENTPDMQIEKIVTQHLKSLMQIEGAHADRSPKNDENVQNDEKMGQTVHINRLKPAFVLGVPDETFIDPHDSPSNPRDVATPEPLDTTLTPETNKEDWYESYGWSTPAAVAPAPVPTTSSKEHTPRTPRGEASTQHSIPSELDRDMDADHNFDRSTERETERSEIPHGTDDPQTSRADRHEIPLRHTKHHDESADRNADRNATRNDDRNADRHKVRCTEEVNEDGEPIESSDEEFEKAKEDPPAKRLCHNPDDELDDDEESEIGKFPISKELKKKLIKTLFETYFFGPYAVEDMSRAVDIMKRVTVKPGDVIIKQGDKGDDSRSIYAIESGTYDVIWSNTNGHLKLKLHTYNNYGLFGEYAQHYNRIFL
ncbi:hypothetical protein GE061_004315 [Apolygus lucorum]|uniref:Cyclic nucleotide-binding domain-containing protein n=1 Tax=Apolygus lucorum TaxID=248454 RepID=A0A8S9X0C9_APOLU|nr:hypothetical protein GE061_004315 [Apolygus lucorum]